MEETSKRAEQEEGGIKFEDDISKDLEKRIINIWSKTWSTLALVIAVFATIQLAQVVQPNAQNLSLELRINHDISESALIYRIASSSDATVFAVVNNESYDHGIQLVYIALLFQILSVWGSEALHLFRKGFGILLRIWRKQ